MKYINLIFLISLLLLFSFKEIDEKTCIKGQTQYSPANYHDEIFLKDKYRKLFDSLLTKSTFECFCKKKIKRLPQKYEDKIPKRIKEKYSLNKESILEEVSIEPLFVNLEIHEGLYSKRTWNTFGYNPRFDCGYFHSLFIISNQTYYDLTNDSLKNVRLVQKKLKNSFSKSEIQQIIDWDISKNSFCNTYTFYPPQLIKYRDSIYWNIEEEIK